MKKVQKEQSEKTQREWKSAIQVMLGLRKIKYQKFSESLNKFSFYKALKIGQKEQRENIEKQKELNLKVIENLDTKIEVRSS